MNSHMKTDRVLIIGLGLIGGSFAQALKKQQACREVLGISRSADTVQKAIEKGVVDHADTELPDLLKKLNSNDVVVIATPTLQVQTICEQLQEAVARGVIVTDVASVKGSVVAAAQAVFGKLPTTFIPGHPIAGSEKSGIDAANAELFVRHEVILTPAADSNPQALDIVTQLWRAVGAEVSIMPVTEHDNVLALTSHLPHILAYTLVDTLAQRSQNNSIFRYAAGGFRDFTRIASSDPTMWHDIALANRNALLNGLDDFEKHLRDLRSAIENNDSQYLHDLFSRAKKSRDYFGELYARRQEEK
jgi:3-phosphoshikimate 1-carboxyvinyltransferase